MNDLEIEEIFKNKNKEKGVGVIDFINKIVQMVRRDLD